MHRGGGSAAQEEEGDLGEVDYHQSEEPRSSEEHEDSDAASSDDGQSGSEHGSPKYRVKSTARKSTGTYHLPRQLATKSVAPSADYEYYESDASSAEDDSLGEGSAEDDDKDASEGESSGSSSERESPRYRVKQTARKSTGSYHPPRQLATRSVAPSDGAAAAAAAGKPAQAVDLTSEDEPAAKRARTHEVVRDSVDSSAAARANLIDLTDEQESAPGDL